MDSTRNLTALSCW